MSFANLPNSYRLTQSDMAICEKASARVWLNDDSNGTADDWLLDDIFNTATQLRDATGKLPTIGEIREQWAAEKKAIDLPKYRAAQAMGGLYDHRNGQIYPEPKRLDREHRERLQREQAEALR